MVRRRKMKKTGLWLPPFLVIALVLLSVAGAIAVSPSQVVASNEEYGNTTATVVIVNPVTTYPLTQFSECQYFYVNAMIYNTGDNPADGLSALLNVTPADQCSINSTNPINLYTSVPVGAWAGVAWNLHCDKAGLANITATVTGTNVEPEEGEDEISDTVEIRQVVPATLEVVISEPESCTDISVCQNFDLVVSIENTGYADARDVTATVNITPASGAQEVSGPEPGYPNDGWYIAGKTTKSGVKWVLHCNGTGDVDISVTARGYDVNSGYLTRHTSEAVTVHQEEPPYLRAVIDLPTGDETYSFCQNFEVEVTVYNDGEAGAKDCKATIEITGPADTGELLTKDTNLTTIASYSNATVSWTLHCNGSGPVTIKVTPAGTDENSNLPIPGTKLQSDTVTVDQEWKAHLFVEVTTSVGATGAAVFSVCQQFTVTATVTNQGEAVAKNVWADITITGDAVVVTGADPQPLGDLDPLIGGGSDTATWILHCNGTDDVTINVTATGTDENTGQPIHYDNILPLGGAEITVIQEAKAHLVVEITSHPQELVEGTLTPTYTYSTCQTFTVNATVTNTGEATALNVTATIDPGATAYVEAGSNPQTFVSIAGGGVAEASWTLHCNSSGPSVITVTATGTDENTGKAIHDNNVEPDSVTVQQELEASLRAVIDYPQDGEAFSVCQWFWVEATVYNDGEADALNCTATIDIDGTAHTLDPLTDTSPGTIPGGGFALVSWELHCDDLGDVTITVSPAGTDENKPQAIPLIPDSVTIHQAYMIDLWGPEYEPEINPDGWNQISLMVRPNDTDIAVVLDSVKDKVVSVWYYNAAPTDLIPDWGGKWLGATYDSVAGWSGDLKTMEDGKGYWIQVTNTCTIALEGTPVVPPELGSEIGAPPLLQTPPQVPPSYRVYKGWNLVGFSSLESMPLNEYFFSLYYNDILKKVWWWGSGPWYQWWIVDDIVYIDCFDVQLMPSTAVRPSGVVLQPGQGYWIWVAEDSEIVVPWNEYENGIMNYNH